MANDEWADADADDPRLRALCGYALRKHVRYQDGRNSLAPTLVFADADYEVGDGTCGLHSDGKQANEPAIVYTRADSLIDAQAEKEAAVAAEREACAEIAKRFDDASSCMGCADTIHILEAIRARIGTDPLTARDARVRAEALREAAEICAAARDKLNKQRNDYPDESRDVKQRWMAGALQSQFNAVAILAIIPADQEGDG